MKGLSKIVPTTYQTDDMQVNNHSAVERVPMDGNNSPNANMPMVGAVYNQVKEIQSTQDTINTLVSQNAKKDIENARLNAENEQLAKQNKALEEKQKKMGRECQLVECDGSLFLRWSLYETPVYLANRIINSVVMVRLDTKERIEIFYLIMSEGSPKGQLLIKGKDLYTDRLVDDMKKYLESPLNVEGFVKRTKMKDLITAYLLGKIDSEQESIVLHEHAGWHDSKWFSADFKDENTARLLKAEFPELPMMKRKWKTGNTIGMLPELDPEDECAYLSVMVGAVCLSIFHNVGIHYTPIAWVENTPGNRMFLQNYCTVWQDYIETAEADTAYNKRSILEAFRSAKDETVLIFSGNGRNKRCSYVDELLESTYYGFQYRQKVEIQAVPIIVSEEFYSYVNEAEQELPILPLLFCDKFSECEFNIAIFLRNLVFWIEQNYKEVLGVIDFVKNKGKSDMRIFLYGVLCICWLYRNQISSELFIAKLEQEGYQKAGNMVAIMIAKFEEYLHQDALEIFRSALHKFQKNNVLNIEEIIAIIEENSFNKEAYMLYDTDGTCCLTNDSFRKIVDGNSGIPPKILLKKLSAEGVIQSNQNGSGRTTNSCNIKLHFVEREKTVKMIRFFPGKLMNGEGATFGGELL